MKTLLLAIVIACAIPIQASAQNREPSGAWVLRKFASGYEEFWANTQGKDAVLALGRNWCRACPGYAVGLMYMSPHSDEIVEVMTQDAKLDGDTLTFRTVFMIPFLNFVSTTYYHIVFHPNGTVASGDYIERVQTYFGMSEFYGDIIARKDGDFPARR